MRTVALATIAFFAAGISSHGLALALATPISCGSVSGEITSPMEQDTYTFEASAGDIVFMGITETSGNWCPRADLYAPSSSVPIRSTPQCGGPSLATPLNVDGVYSIVVRDRDNHNTGGYSFNLQFTNGSCGPPISCGTVVLGDIEHVSDRDAYTFQANAGEAVNITVAGSAGFLCAQADVYDPAGAWLSDTGGSCSGSTGGGTGGTTTLPAGGTYTILVHSRDFNNAGNYSLKLLFTSGRCGTPILCETVAPGNITYKEERIAYTFEGNADEAVIVTAQSPGNELCVKADLYDPNGAKLGDTGGLCGGYSATAVLPVTGTYTVMVHSRDFNGTGAFSVDLKFVAKVRERPCAVAIPCGWDNPGSIAEIAQQDAYLFCGLANQQVNFGIAASSELCARADLYDPTGALLTTTICGGGGVGSLTADGIYTILVHSDDLRSTGTYRMHLACSDLGCPTDTPDAVDVGSASIELRPSFPNPVNPRTMLAYFTPREMDVRLTIHDVAGRLIATLADHRQAAGNHHIVWDGTDSHDAPVGSGVYFVRLAAGSDVRTGKLVVSR